MTISNPNAKKRRSKKPPSTGNNNLFTTILLVLALLGSMLAIWRPWQHSDTLGQLWSEQYKFLNLGLDLQGGLRVTLEIDKDNPKPEDVEKVKTIVENRINALGVAEPVIQTQGNNRVVVELPGLKQADQDRALKLIGEQAVLEFRIVKDGAQPDKTTGDYSTSDLGPVLATGDIISTASAQTDQFGNWVVSFQTTAKGRQKLADLTQANVGKLMAIVLDGKIKSAATIREPLTNGGQISGRFDANDAANLSLVLKSGSLPVPIKPSEVRAIGPTLGADAIRSGSIAALVGVVLVFILAFIYYGPFFGAVIALGLLFSAIMIIGMLGGLGATLTLPGIAGLVLTIGAAVDGNVISFERIKEELRANKGIKSSINAGFGHSLATILDVNFSHLLAALALFNYSSGPVKGFAVTLAVGVLASVFSNLVFSKWMLETMAKKWNFSAPMWFSTPNIDFIKASPIVTSVSVALAILGGAIIATKGLQYGVDFTSGTAFTVNAAASVDVEAIRKTLDSVKIKGAEAANAVIQRTQTPGLEGAQFTVKVAQLSTDNIEKLSTEFAKLPKGSVQQTETIGPAIGQELRTNTLLAVALSLSLILIYVWFRFDFVFGFGSVLAVLHDVAIVVGLYALLGREFSIATVAAILTLIGYSLNDSIIVSDRMRENLRTMRGASFKDIVNAAINQTLSRTLMTSLTTMLPLVSLFLFGGAVLRDFSMALIVGILVGTYSSIYIVAPLVVYYENWITDRRKGKPSNA